MLLGNNSFLTTTYTLSYIPIGDDSVNLIWWLTSDNQSHLINLQVPLMTIVQNDIKICVFVMSQ